MWQIWDHVIDTQQRTKTSMVVSIGECFRSLSVNVQETTVSTLEDIHVGPARLLKAIFISQSAVLRRHLGASAVLMRGTIWAVQKAPVLHVSLLREMCSLCSSSKHSLTLRGQGKHLELRNLHFNTINSNAPRNILFYLQ